MFKTKRFGMFIHWGLYSIGAWHEQMQMRYPVASGEYEEYLTLFNPTDYNPREWVKLAKECGVDYICFTTKHHDGFCMWDTEYTDYKVTNTPYGKDVLKMLSDACEEEGMALSLYYSVPDWHHPNYPNNIGHHEIRRTRATDRPDEALYIEYVKNQIRELMTGYGKIQSFFWDIPPQTRDKSLNELIRSLQPGIYINNRGYDPGDFSTPERTSADGAVFEGLTEACDSVGSESWGFRKNEDYHSNLYLTSSIDRYMAMGANFVLNVGPDDKGKIPESAVQAFKKVGGWYNSVKEALFAKAVKYDLFAKKGILSTRNGNTLYLHFPNNPNASGLYLENILALPKTAVVLNNGKSLHFSMDTMPSLYDGKNPTPEAFHIYGIDINELSGEAIVLRLEFDDLDSAVVNETSLGINKRIL